MKTFRNDLTVTLTVWLMLVCMVHVVCAQGTVAYNPVMRYKGAYAGGTSYLQMDVVTSSGVTYVSLIANNVGNTPATSPSDWSAITAAGGVISFNTRSGAVVLNAGDIQTALTSLTGCSTSGNAYNPSTNTCVTYANSTLSNVNPVAGRNSLGAAQAPSLPGTNLLAYYTFLNGSGTTVTNVNNPGTNDATLCTGSLGTAPAWIPNTGIQPNYGVSANTDCVQLPIALDAALSIDMGIYINPIQSSQTDGTSPNAPQAALSASLITSSALPFYSSQAWVANSNTGQGTSIFTPLTFNGTAPSNNTPVTGYHVLGVDFGVPNGLGGCTTTDALFIDGAPIPSPYTSTGCLGGITASPDHLYVGPAPAGSGSGAGPWQAIGYTIPGPIYSLAAYSTRQGAGHALVSQVFHAENANRGAATTPPIQYTQLPCQIAIGDSITYGFPSFTPYPMLIAPANPPTSCLYINAISGITIDASSASEAYRSAPWCTTPNGAAVATIFLATNNFLFFNETPQTTFNKLMRHAGIMKRAGCRTFVFTMLSRCSSVLAGCTGMNGSTYDVNKNAFNQLVISGAVASGNVDGVIDAANFKGLGADGSSAIGEWVANFALTSTTQFIIDSNGNKQQATTLGTTAGTQPTWCTTVSCTTTDNTVVWTLTTLAPTGRCVTALSATPGISGTVACFRTEDQTHPTQAGQYEIASIDTNYQNYVFGFSKANPHSLTSTTSAYPMTTADGAIIIKGTAAQPITLPDCTGLSGKDFFISNQSSAAATISVLDASQPINGSTSNVTLAAGTSIDLIVNANPYTVSGCQLSH
jgi:hypothetical protein